MAKKPRITVLQPDPEVPLGQFAGWLNGVRLSILGLWEKDLCSLEAAGDGIIVLGGRMNALDHENYPWLDPVGDLLADAWSIGIPIFGICLGHQILADVLGGDVSLGSCDEEGAVELNWTPDATDDPVFGAAAACEYRHAPESHHDEVTSLPAGATLMAGSDGVGIQAFRLGSAWGAQFHPEADVGQIVAWHDGNEKDALGASCRYHAESFEAIGRSIAASFVDVVRG